MKAVSKTAYYCGGVRMQDAESAKPLIGDHYAKRLLGEDGIAYWSAFKQFTRPNAGNTARHYLIDSFIKNELTDHPDATIILIGAGLDSRAYRLDGGKWIEIDEEAIIAHKNNKLPINECKNPLERIPIDFEKEKLADKLQPYRERPYVIFIIEGVLMYLTNEQRNELLTTLTTLFPKHVLFCDLMNKGFFEKFSGEIHRKLSESGAVFKDIADEPDRVFIAKGYKKRSVTGMPQAIHDLGLIRLPWFVRKFVFGRLINGYAVYHFTYGY
ncbi:class I SAM-dependent methyltransferase [Niastella sp. OAS944]|uniref:class I SAM-dependent methyltransferase n=1 Tax=Niastella sp. OAS944 TaxID=2664089 RepID=UPI0034930EB6|nr:methyltransferase (TIGR00027 family) [Chitinophagaceae bacterium OAS944]